MRQITAILLLTFFVNANASSWSEKATSDNEPGSASSESNDAVGIESMWKGFKSLWVSQPNADEDIQPEADSHAQSAETGTVANYNSEYVETGNYTYEETNVMPSFLADLLPFGREEGQVKDHEKHGTWTEWYYGGEKRSEIEYNNGLEHGMTKYWYRNGQQKKTVRYINGKKDGKEIWWHENGQKWYQTSYRNGEQYGKTTWWFDDGKVQSETYYGDLPATAATDSLPESAAVESIQPLRTDADHQATSTSQSKAVEESHEDEGAQQQETGLGLGKMWNSFTSMWSNDSQPDEDLNAELTGTVIPSEKKEEPLEAAASESPENLQNNASENEGDVVNENWLWSGKKKQYRGY
jgi:protein tyrosine phosphatase (PTP) superfamily phosphohydrolase (DUF442 family)